MQLAVTWKSWSWIRRSPLLTRTAAGVGNMTMAVVTAAARHCLARAECARWSRCDTTWTSTWNSCGCHADAPSPEPAYEAGSLEVHQASCCQAGAFAAAGKMSSCTAAIYSVVYCSSTPNTPGWTCDRCRPEYGQDSCTLTTVGVHSDIWISETVRYHS